MSPKNPDDEASKASGVDFSSIYPPQTISDSRNYGITAEDIISTDWNQSKKADEIRGQDANFPLLPYVTI
jgi:hypothetical protein